MQFSTEIQDLIDELEPHIEGDQGVKSLHDLVKRLGYDGHNFKYGTPIESFLSDNPGAIEAIHNWIINHADNEWVENLQATLPER